jgi:hypothetical protein
VVGAQHVSEHEGVEPVALVAGLPVAEPQVADLVRCDHEHHDPASSSASTTRLVGSFDRHPLTQQSLLQMVNMGGDPVHAIVVIDDKESITTPWMRMPAHPGPTPLTVAAAVTRDS